MMEEYWSADKFAKSKNFSFTILAPQEPTNFTKYHHDKILKSQPVLFWLTF